MTTQLYPFPRYLSLTLLAASFAAAGCSVEHDSLATGGAAITAGALDDQLDAIGETRVEVELAADDSTAHEIEIYPVSMLADEEHVESLVESVDPTSGTITLALGGLSVSIAEGARFRTPDDSDAPASAWYEVVTAALAAGDPVFVRVVRPAPAAPQAPEDSSFVATELRLEEVDAPKIEINVDGDNLEASGDTGTLLVLGMKVAITGDSWIHASDDETTGGDDGSEAPETETEHGPELESDDGPNHD